MLSNKSILDMGIISLFLIWRSCNMRVAVCIPNPEEREFCIKRINVFAEIDCITLTIDVVNTTKLAIITLTWMSLMIQT